MNDSEWFSGWVELHCIATGADADGKGRTRAAIMENRNIFLVDWKSTSLELGECTARLVRNNKTPKFPNEHCDAIGRELNELRVQRDRGHNEAQAAALRDAANRRACSACDGTGLATIPHPKCLIRGERGGWVLATARGNGRVMCCTVPCDRPECVAGDAVRAADKKYRETKERLKGKSVATLDDFERHYGVDLVAMWRAFERGRELQAKQEAAPDSDWTRLCTSLLTKARSIRR